MQTHLVNKHDHFIHAPPGPKAIPLDFNAVIFTAYQTGQSPMDLVNKDDNIIHGTGLWFYSQNCVGITIHKIHLFLTHSSQNTGFAEDTPVTVGHVRK